MGLLSKAKKEEKKKRSKIIMENRKCIAWWLKYLQACQQTFYLQTKFTLLQKNWFLTGIIKRPPHYALSGRQASDIPSQEDRKHGIENKDEGLNITGN